MVPDRWQPSDEDDLRRAIGNSDLVENHWFEGKREVNSSESSRRNIAKAIASLAIDGGTLVVGIEEIKAERTWSLQPQPLQGLSERIALIATSAIDPPVRIHTRTIETATDAEVGYVVVAVPPSPVCPHQVDGRYFGRSDTVSYRLSDPEIVRYLQRRTSWSTAATRMLDELETDDPGSDADRDVGRLYLVAQPVLAARDSAVEFLADPERLLPVVRRESGYVGRELDLDPYLSSLSYYTPTAEGAAYRSRGRDDLSKETHRLEVELREDGGIRVLSGRMTAQRPERDPSKIILDQRVVAFAHRLVAWAVDVSSQINYGATWALGIRATGLKDGISAKLAPQFGGFDAPPYTGTSYTATTEAVVAELTDNPQAVVQRLVGKLIRSLGATTFYQRELGLNQAP